MPAGLIAWVPCRVPEKSQLFTYHKGPVGVFGKIVVRGHFLMLQMDHLFFTLVEGVAERHAKQAFGHFLNRLLALQGIGIVKQGLCTVAAHLHIGTVHDI